MKIRIKFKENFIIISNIPQTKDKKRKFRLNFIFTIYKLILKNDDKMFVLISYSNKLILLRQTVNKTKTLFCVYF